MTVSTVDHAGYLPEPTTTPVFPRITAADLPEVTRQQIEALRMDAPVHPDRNARARYATLLYQVTRWNIFRDAAEQAGYAALARENEAEDVERRQIARRRPPHWADED
jgi:hypothetical protein